MELTEVSVYGN
jgi:hypothetical protein